MGPQTLEQFNARVVESARALKVTRGRRLWVDGMVVETISHHPTDSRLLGDGVRVLGRLLRRAKQVLGAGAAVGPAAFHTLRRIRRLAQQVHRVARRKGQAATEE
jgi:IS5 family transposase